MISGHLPIGAIVGPQGIKGQFKVKSFTATPQALSAYGPVTLDDGRQLQLQVTSVNAKGLAIVWAKGVETREAAEALRYMANPWSQVAADRRWQGVGTQRGV